MKLAGLILLATGAVLLLFGFVCAVTDGSISEVFSHFGEGRGAGPTIWWLVVPTLFFIVGYLLVKNARSRQPPRR